MTKITLPNIIWEFVSTHRLVVNNWEHTGLKFTLDGRLVGDIAEAVAAQEFCLEFPSKRTPGVDLLTLDRKTVQVKASGIGKGPAFSPGKGRADFLIFMLLHFDEAKAEIIYNGLEAPVREMLPSEFSGTKRVSLNELVKLNKIQKERVMMRSKE
jgi:hypothetical protein